MCEEIRNENRLKIIPDSSVRRQEPRLKRSFSCQPNSSNQMKYIVV